MLFICINLCCCANVLSFEKSICIKSNEFYDISVRRSTEDSDYSVYLPIYSNIIYTEDQFSSPFTKEENNFIVGENCYLEGSNVYQLDGTRVYVFCSKFSDFYDENFLQNAIERIVSLSGNAESTKVLSRVEEASTYYYNNVGFISISMTIQGEIFEDIKVDKLVIPEFDFSYEYNRFVINTIDDDYQRDDSLIEGHAISGFASCNSIDKIGLSNFQYVTPLKDLRRIRIESLNDYAFLLTSENIEKYDPEMDYQSFIFNDVSYKAHNSIEVSFAYVYNQDLLEIDKINCFIACFRVIYEDYEGNTSVDYLYSSSSNYDPFSYLYDNILQYSLGVL